jgi:hypothetical protein
VCDNGRLVSRWLEPITLVLYPLIFEHEPVRRVQDAAKFTRRQSVAWQHALVREVRLELETPTQAVRDILDCRGSEKDLREFLRLLADEVARGLPPNAGNDGESGGAV